MEAWARAWRPPCTFRRPHRRQTGTPRTPTGTRGDGRETARGGEDAGTAEGEGRTAAATASAAAAAGLAGGSSRGTLTGARFWARARTRACAGPRGGPRARCLWCCRWHAGSAHACTRGCMCACMRTRGCMRARMHASLLVYACVRACVPACVCRELCVRARQHWLCVCEAERVLVRIWQHRACARARAHLQTLHARALTHPHARSRTPALMDTRTHGHHRSLQSRWLKRRWF